MEKRIFALLLAALVLVSGSALAGTPLGVRLGYTDWDGLSQLHFGGHIKTGELFPNVDFTPGVEMGIGDNTTIITFNGDLVYKFTELTEAPWGLYAGGSLSLNYVNFHGFGSDENLGLTGLVGTTHLLDNGHEIMAEIRLGLMDSPDFKITGGYTFF